DITFRTETVSELFTGVSFTLKDYEGTDEIVSTIAATNIFRVQTIPRPEPVSVELDADLANADPQALTKYNPELIHTLTGVNDLRTRLGLTGKGIKVAVLDSGVDYMNPALGGGFGKGFKVSYGYDLVGDSYGTTGIPVPDADPMDNCSDVSHGTHVAGIIAADTYSIPSTSPLRPPFNFTGVAPDVEIGAYRLFGCSGGVGTDIVAAGIFRAAADGSHVINLSLGGGPVFNDGADAYAAEVVSRTGAIVVASNGNSQSGGIMTNGSPAVSRSAIASASFDNSGLVAPILSVDGAEFYYSPGSNANFATTAYDIYVNDINAEDTNKQNDGISTVNAPAAARGKAMLIRWGDSTLGGSAARCNYALRSGATACIIYSNVESVPGIAGGNLPSLATTNAAGRAIIAAVRAGRTPKLIVTTRQGTFANPTAGTVSDFSAMGLDPELFIKPDVGGIGGNVYSTVSRRVSGLSLPNIPYRLMSGTSMSSPYNAGQLALLVQARGNIGVNTAKALLQNTARPANIFRSNLTDSVARQGAGLANIYAAITTKTLITPSALNLNDTQYTRSTHYTLTIQNTDSVPKTFTVRHRPAAMATGFVPGDDAIQLLGQTRFTADYADVKFARLNDRVDAVNVTVPANSTNTINVHFKPPANAIPGLFPIYSGYITFSPAGEPDVVASVPYAGMVGRWRDAPIWIRKSPSYTAQYLRPSFPTAPLNATYSAGFYADRTFTPLNPTVPQVFNFSRPTVTGLIAFAAGTTSRYAKIEILFAGNETEKARLPRELKHKSPLGYIFNGGTFIFDQVSRNVPVANIQGLARPALYGWRGLMVTSDSEAAVPFLVPGNTTYQIKMSALKHFGRVGAKGDSNYDVILSAPFRVVY
ncbi:hypothetical protein HDU96_000560, partial [Phlyctochytrium bullatum]